MKPEINPKVSIIIPVHNGTNYMREAIDSALNQTYDNVEVIVVNDGSTDDGATDAIARAYGSRIRYFCKMNGGVSSALNVGIQNMTGEYFSWLSHDDVYAPKKVQNQIEHLLNVDDKRVIALCRHYFIDENSIRMTKKASRKIIPGLHDYQAVLRSLLSDGTLNGCSMLIPREAFEECGVFDESLRFSQDALKWLEIFLKKYSLLYSEDEDVGSRIHSKQLTQTGKDLFKKDSLSIAKIVIPKLAAVGDERNDFLYLFAKRYAVHGVRAVVDECLDVGSYRKQLSFQQCVALKLIVLYGNVRPFLRKIYYKFFVK